MLLQMGPVITLVPSTRDITTTKFKSAKGNSLFVQSFKFVNSAWTLLNMSLVYKIYGILYFLPSSSLKIFFLFSDFYSKLSQDTKK